MRSILVLLVVAAALAGAAGAEDGARITRDVVYARPGGIPVALDVYRPADIGRRRPAVVLIHGGGFRRGDKAALARFGELIAARGWVAFSVNYRLAPEHVFPAAVQDVRAAVRWIRAHARTYGVDRRRIGAIGSSAGANLAAMLGAKGSGRCDRGTRIAAYASWSGPMDLTIAARDRNIVSVVHPYLGCSLAQCPKTWADASPISHVDRTDSPAFLANSEREIVSVENATTMAARLRAARVPVTLRILPGARHATGFAQDVWPDTIAFLARYLVAPG